MKESSAIIYLLVSLCVSVGIFFLVRSIMLWYWRIDDIVKNQQQQIQLLSMQNRLIESFLKQNKPEQVQQQGNDSREEIERKAKLYDQSADK